MRDMKFIDHKQLVGQSQAVDRRLPEVYKGHGPLLAGVHFDTGRTGSPLLRSLLSGSTLRITSSARLSDVI